MSRDQPYMTILIASSVVRGSHQGESHGGIYLIDVDRQQTALAMDWNTSDIDWQGRGWDRGLRGIAFDSDKIYIAASDELFVYTPEFELIGSHRCPYLKHCHEIYRFERRLYLTSTGYDSILGFDLDSERFSWGMEVVLDDDEFRGRPFNPYSGSGPLPHNELHLNNIFCTKSGMYISGLRTGATLLFNGTTITEWGILPLGAHNARPYRDGVLFNDTVANLVRYLTPDSECAFKVPMYVDEKLTHTDFDDSRIARQGFGRGLCVMDNGVIAAGSSPSTITFHDIDKQKTINAINLTYDIRNAIHGLEVWPYD
jgi:hypothetical protein